MRTPVGFEQIVADFGDIRLFIREDGTIDPRWEAEQLALARLPVALSLCWDPAKSVNSVRVHRKLVSVFEAVFEDLQAGGLLGQLHDFGGAYAYRLQRRGAWISTHAWGIAIDLNVHSNPMGAPGDMPQTIVDAFEAHGFGWGGHWRRRDDMHFQFAQGY